MTLVNPLMLRIIEITPNAWAHEVGKGHFNPDDDDVNRFKRHISVLPLSRLNGLCDGSCTGPTPLWPSP